MAWEKLSGLADGTNGVDLVASLASMALLVVLVASMASMASMVLWMVGGGVDGVDGVDGLASIADGELGSSTQRALTWKSLCVPSGEFGMHRGSLLSVLNSCMRIAVLATCLICFSCSTVCLLPDVFLHSLFCLVMVVYIMTVILAAVLCCL